MISRRTPLWQVLVPIVLLLAILGFIYAVYIRSGNTNAAVNATQASSARRDCVTVLNNARRAVFDNVDIYKAILIRAATDRQLGLPLQGDPEFFRDIDSKLGLALTEATRIRPPEFANGLIEHGGMVDGVHYDGCPA